LLTYTRVLFYATVSFPCHSQLGLVSSPTPFLTGRPHTLFHNGTAYSTGSVGVALSAAPAKAEVVYGIEGLDREFVVER
jgi:hypothetical protein